MVWVWATWSRVAADGVNVFRSYARQPLLWFGAALFAGYRLGMRGVDHSRTDEAPGRTSRFMSTLAREVMKDVAFAVVTSMLTRMRKHELEEPAPPTANGKRSADLPNGQANRRRQHPGHVM